MLAGWVGGSALVPMLCEWVAGALRFFPMTWPPMCVRTGGRDPRRCPASGAPARLTKSYAGQAGDPEDGVVFWLALAAAQQETGRLTPDVRETALEILDRGGDVARWEAEAPGLAKQRKLVLDRLREKLAGPQGAPKRFEACGAARCGL